MVLQETIDNVLAIPIQDVIGLFVQLKRSGSNYKGKSPFVDERTPSFMVSPTKGIFKDFSSGKGGNAIGFVMEHEHMTFPEATKFICEKFNVPFLETAKSNEESMLEQYKESMRIIVNFAQQYYRNSLMSVPGAYQYATGERQLRPDIIDRFAIGYAPGSLGDLANMLIQNGYNWNLAVQATVLGYSQERNQIYDFFRDRLMFPIRGLSGNILGFGGRLTVQKEKAPKYLNSSDSLLYNKSEVLYGLFESKNAIIKQNHAFLSEGYVDVVMWHQIGIENIVAAAGTALTSEQCKMLKRFTKNVTVLFDGDAAGINAAIRGIDILLAEDMNVKVLVLPAGQDPDDFAKANALDVIQQYIGLNSKDFVLFKLNHLLAVSGDDLNMRSAAITDVINSVSKIPNSVKREVYLKECARITEMDVNSLRTMLKQFVEEEADFSQVNFDSFQDQSHLSRTLIREQCERKILQYALAYGNETLTFKELVMVDMGNGKFIEEIETVKSTVFHKIEHELAEDDFYFHNAEYQSILDKAKLIHLSQFHLLKDHLPAESYLLAEQLRREEYAINSNVFLNTNAPSADIVRQELILALEKSINETLLFYKTVHLEIMIDELTAQEEPNTEELALVIELLVKIKKELNFI